MEQTCSRPSTKHSSSRAPLARAVSSTLLMRPLVLSPIRPLLGEHLSSALVSSPRASREQRMTAVFSLATRRAKARVEVSGSAMPMTSPRRTPSSGDTSGCSMPSRGLEEPLPGSATFSPSGSAPNYLSNTTRAFIHAIFFACALFSSGNCLGEVWKTKETTI